MLRSSLMLVLLKNKRIFILLILLLIALVIAVLTWYPKKTPDKAALPTPPPPKYQTTSGKPPQFVLLSFDGSLSLDMWRETRSFAQQMKADKKPVHFTYFISGVYFLAPQYAGTYHPPLLPAGTSAIKFSNGLNSIPDRIEALNKAYLDGHEIGSHANGHFRGGVWNEKSWAQEFSEFNNLIFNWKENNHLVDSPINLAFGPKDIVGFRAPLLSRNNNLFTVENKDGYLYDSSELATSSAAWPNKDNNGLWHIPLSEIPLYGTKNKIIAMDYNFYDTQTGAKDTLKRGTPAWQKAYEQVYTSYINYFNSNYTGNRAPVLIGHHFSLWNDGLYWSVMQDFARNVCGDPEVYCVTFKELVEYLNSHPVH